MTDHHRIQRSYQRFFELMAADGHPRAILDAPTMPIPRPPTTGWAYGRTPSIAMGIVGPDGKLVVLTGGGGGARAMRNGVPGGTGGRGAGVPPLHWPTDREVFTDRAIPQIPRVPLPPPPWMRRYIGDGLEPARGGRYTLSEGDAIRVMRDAMGIPAGIVLPPDPKPPRNSERGELIAWAIAALAFIALALVVCWVNL